MKNIKKTTLALSLILGLSSAASFAQNSEDNSACNSNVLHYAASINDLDYFQELLNMNSFTLTDLNHACDSVYHIAIQNNNQAILETLFDYIDIENMLFNKNGENLIQYAIKNQQAEILIFLINNGLDPHSESKNGKTGVDYQNDYGNEVTSKILGDYDRTQLLVNVSNEKDNYRKLLGELKASLEIKESQVIDENEINQEDQELLYSQQNLRQEIVLMRNQIEFLTNVIDQKNAEIEKLRGLLKESNISEDIMSEKDFDNDAINDILNGLSTNKGVLEDINNETIGEETDKIFDLFSRPIYKLQDKE